jgi:predicted dinucleotide-binding enzyme
MKLRHLSVVTVLSCLLASVALAETIAVIGTGSVGSALGSRFAAVGHTVVYGSRRPRDADVLLLVNETGNGATVVLPSQAAKTADIILLAVPWAAAEKIVKGLGSLDGKIIIDPINALAFGPEKSITLAASPSAAEQIQAWAPGARVVKAFNTLTSAFMTDPSAAGGPITIPLAGNDDAAKARVADLVIAVGLVPLDVGKLNHARVVEAMGQLYVAQGYQGRQRFEFNLRPR